MSRQETVLELQQIEKRAGKEMLLDGVSLVVQKGEAVALIGPEAAGKTCLLDVILGLQSRQGGKILFQGNIRKGKCLQEEITYVPSIPPLFGGSLTSEQLFRMTENKKRKSFRENWAEYCDYFEIPAEKPLAGMTYGQNRLVSFIHAMMQEPELILIDDMESYLEGEWVSRLFSLFQERGMTVLYTERELEPTCSFCSRAYFLENGRITGEYEPNTLHRKSVITLPKREAWMTYFLRGKVLKEKGEYLFYLYEGSRTFLFQICQIKGISSIWLEPLTIDEQLLEDYERWRV